MPLQEARPNEASQRKLHVVRLAGSLLDAHAAACAAAGEARGAAESSPAGDAEAFGARAAVALPLLLAAYGATRSAADNALFAVLCTIDRLGASHDGSSGPLASAGCVAEDPPTSTCLPAP